MSYNRERLAYLERQLEKMKQSTTYSEGYDIRGGDVYGGKEKETTVGNRSEIAAIEAEIKKYRKLVDEEDKFIESRSQTQNNQNIKEETLTRFKQLKKRYDNKNMLIKAFNKISGKTPNWNKIKDKIDSGEIEYDYEVNTAVKRGM